MRDLLDTDTWEDDLTGLGPEVGDPANGEEVSVIGDALGKRTRWLYTRTLGNVRCLERKVANTVSAATLLTLNTDNYATFASLTGTVLIALADIIEITTEVHIVGTTEDDQIVLDHAIDTNPGSSTFVGSVVERYATSNGTNPFVHITYTSTFTAGAAMVGFTPRTRSRARLFASSNVGSPTIRGPALQRLAVWRAS